MIEAAALWREITPAFWESILLTLRLAFVSTFLLLLIGIPFAHWLNRSRWRGIIFIETLATMPIWSTLNLSAITRNGLNNKLRYIIKEIITPGLNA